MQECQKCGKVKPDRAFARKRAAPSGLQEKCRECMAAWYRDHKDDVAAQQAGYRQAHAAEIAGRRAGYARDNPELVREQKRASARRHPETGRAGAVRRKRADPEGYRAAQAAASRRYRQRQREARQAAGDKASMETTQDTAREILADLAAAVVAAHGGPAMLRRAEVSGLVRPGAAERIVRAAGIIEPAPPAQVYDPLCGAGWADPRPPLRPAGKPLERVWDDIEHDPRYVAAVARGGSPEEVSAVFEAIVSERKRQIADARQARRDEAQGAMSPALADAARQMPGHRALQAAAQAEQIAARSPAGQFNARTADEMYPDHGTPAPRRQAHAS